MTSKIPRGGQRTVARALALLLLLALVLAHVPSALAGDDLDGADVGRIEPALQAKARSNPRTTFRVIVQREVGRDKSTRKIREAEVERELKAEGGQVQDRLGLIGGHVVTLNAKAIAKMSRNRLVRAISLDHPVQVHEVADDRTEASSTGSGAPGAMLSTWTQAANAPQVWSTYGNRGAGVGVAVLDSGIQPGPDLSNVTFGADVVTGSGALGDAGGHGTHVAGIIAGNGGMSNGAYRGVAPDARLISVKVTNDTGGASYASVIKGLQWVVENKDVHDIRVANLSLGATATTSYADDPLAAAVEIVWFRGVVVVASAGNAGPGAGTISVPGNDPYAVTVGALDDSQTAAPADDVVPDWTSRGPTAVDGIAKPDLAASGRRVVSLRVPGSYLDRLLPDRVMGGNGQYFRLSGTSMATPIVSGVAALVIAQNRSLRPDQVKAILVQSARPTLFSAGTVGAGAVDALAAVKLAAAGGVGRANQGLRVNRRAAAALWGVVKTMKPVWRHTGNWNGRYWADGSWDASGFLANGVWTDGSWDAVAWDNFRWTDGSWDLARWLDGSWDTLSASSIMLTDGSWDRAGFAD